MHDFKSSTSPLPKVNPNWGRDFYGTNLDPFFGGIVLGSILLFGPVHGQDPPVSPPTPPAPSQAAPSSSVPSTNTLLTPDKERDLFDALDLSLPALAPVREAVAKGDYATAQHELAQYFRQRTSPPWKFDPHHPDKNTPYDKQVADDAVKGRVTGGHIPVWANFLDGKIDWLYNETDHEPGVSHNGDWQGQLTRMDFWDALGAAYLATGDEKYPKAWMQQLRSFIIQCPPPAETPVGQNVISGWRPINVGCRMLASWPDAFYSFVDSPSLSDEDLLVAVYGFLLNGQYLSTHHGPGNGLLMERQGLYTIGAIFPEFKQAAEWRDQAVKGEVSQRAAMFLRDGVEAEVTTSYHIGAVENVMSLPKIAKLTGRLDEIPPDYIGPMEKAYEFEMYLMSPDRQMPMFNDASRVHVPGLIQAAVPFFPNRQDFLWTATDGKQGQPPAQTSYAFDYAGLYAMRSSWDTNANYLAFFDGPYVSSHGHQDKLIVVMWAYGREILFNSGGATYDGSIWRRYSVDTFSKNTVLVDGLPQHRPPAIASPDVPKIDSRWESTPDHDFVAGTYNDAYGDKGLHPATHVRRVLFLKPDLGIVADTLTPNDAVSHTYQARWNLLTTQTQLIDATHEVVTTDPNQPNLDIVPLNPDGLDVRSASGQLEPELLGWNVLHTTVKQPAAATSVLQTRQGTGVQTFLTLLVPIPSGATDPVKSVVSNGPGTATVTFNDGRTLAITADADPTGGIEATELLANGSPGRHVKAGEQHP